MKFLICTLREYIVTYHNSMEDILHHRVPQPQLL
jgi:hypothetical protein